MVATLKKGSGSAVLPEPEFGKSETSVDEDKGDSKAGVGLVSAGDTSEEKSGEDSGVTDGDLPEEAGPVNAGDADEEVDFG